MAPPRSAFGASPSRGRHQRPGQAGSAVALEQAVRLPGLRVAAIQLENKLA
jgi:hypothetical protein